MGIRTLEAVFIDVFGHTEQAGSRQLALGPQKDHPELPFLAARSNVT